MNETVCTINDVLFGDGEQIFGSLIKRQFQG